MEPPSPSRRRQQQHPPPARQPRILHQLCPIPWPQLASLILSPRNANVKYLRSRAQFWYRPDPTERPNEWKRAYGLTYMLKHAFWPQYDRTGNAYLSLAIDQTKQQYYAQRSKQLKLYGKHKAALQRSRTGRGRQSTARGTKTTEEITRLAAGKPKEAYGARMGELVHKQLHVWALDRACNTRHFGVDPEVEWPPNERTQAIIHSLTRELSVDIRFGELMIYDPRVPVATSIDLLGWSASRRSVVVVEIKTGSKWNRDMGTGPMQGRAPGVLRLSDAPINQAVAQLACTVAIVQQVYGVKRVDGLLLWANQWLLPVPEVPQGPNPRYGPKWFQFDPSQTEVRLYKRWLSDSEKRMGRIMLVELHQHLQARGGRAWAKPRRK